MKTSTFSIYRFQRISLGVFVLLISVTACTEKESADMIFHNGTIYTINAKFEKTEAFVVNEGRFTAVGTNKDVLEHYKSDEIIDLEGSFVYPGFIDAHAHFYGYGTGLQVADLTASSSYDEVIQRVLKHRKNNPDQAWVLGRGWDQNLWPNKSFPTKENLDELFPDTPVLLTRIDGHAALANQKALDIGNVTSSTSLLGGKVIVENGEPTGILIDNAIGLVAAQVPELTATEKKNALLAAQKNCFEVGLTTVADAGLNRGEIELIEEMHAEGSLKMRIYAMVSPTKENKEYFFERGPSQSNLLTVRSFKVFGDGALGSRGAALLQPYHDAPDEYGFLLSKAEDLESLAEEIYEHGFQMNTHCIGDSANRTLLDIYAKVLKGENDRRWRIEHAQVVNEKDVTKFGEYSIIPSVQPTHATSDMYWAEERLGPERVQDAYVFKELLDQNGMIALGSDFPVESINPMFGFHSAVARKDAENRPENGFQAENKLSRQEALQGMTIWAAYANFEEKLKGTIEAGKLADFVILDQDIMTAPEEELRGISVKATYLGGEKVF
jgi:predicted amidohydrolase YtcJ